MAMSKSSMSYSIIGGAITGWVGGWAICYCCNNAGWNPTYVKQIKNDMIIVGLSLFGIASVLLLKDTLCTK